jgi:hypothetical protein
MNTEKASLERLDELQYGWTSAIYTAACEQVADRPTTPEERLRADIKNEAIWLRNALASYRAIPLVERY